MSRLHALSLSLLLSTLGSSALAVPWIFKHDQFPSDLQAAATAVNGGQFYVQPGFVAGEAFGQIYKPLPEMYPFQITGFDLILAAPPNGGGALYSNATIEIYSSESKTADPGNNPLFSISTGDLLNQATNQFGVPLQGGVGLHVEFDLSQADNRPPMITSGYVWLVVRLSDAARDMSAEWGTFACSIIDIGGMSIGCGCQNVGTVHDAGITLKSNVLHHVAPLGQCSGGKQWSFMETISNGSFTINGDVIMRLRADVAAEPCVPDCDGALCGEDGCGGLCGTCPNNLFCVDGSCVSCQPNCLSRQCGEDGCGGSCGLCGDTQECGPDFFCRARCTGSCAGRECGDDGCGTACGSCEGNETCVAGQCEAPCERQCNGKECGPDGCGGACGSCGNDLECIGGQCEAPCTPACVGLECGSDGCGGNCGNCENDETCEAGQCVAECAPNCVGKECGDDGCGGLCGTCDGGESCQASMCAPTAAALEVLDVSPDFGSALSTTVVSVTGRGFVEGAKVKIGGRDLEDVTFTGGSLIEATVPAGLAPGKYTVIVVNPNGDLGQLVDAFEIRGATEAEGQSDSGCGAGDTRVALGAALVALLTMAQRRRRAT